VELPDVLDGVVDGPPFGPAEFVGRGFDFILAHPEFPAPDVVELAGQLAHARVTVFADGVDDLPDRLRHVLGDFE
jgi:hypothetical protein